MIIAQQFQELFWEEIEQLLRLAVDDLKIYEVMIEPYSLEKGTYSVSFSNKITFDQAQSLIKWDDDRVNKLFHPIK